MSKMEKSFQQLGGSASNSRNTRQNRTRSADMREQDKFMPIANVVRIMRKIIPAHAKISDDAKETILECVSEFISFVTSEANRWCHQDRRKTVTAEDVLWGLNNLGFDDYIEPLKIYLDRLREFENGGEHSGVADAQAKRSIEQPAMGFTTAFTQTFTPIVQGPMGITNTFTPIEQGAMGITSAFTTFTPTEQGAMGITSAFTPIEQGAIGVTTAFTPAAFAPAFAPAFVPAYYVVPHSGVPGVMTMEGFQKDDAQNDGSTSGSADGVTRTFF